MLEVEPCSFTSTDPETKIVDLHDRRIFKYESNGSIMFHKSFEVKVSDGVSWL